MLILLVIVGLLVGVVDRLYEAGCDDALVSSIDGYIIVDFDLDATTYETALKTAQAVIRRAGFSPYSVVDLPPLTE